MGLAGSALVGRWAIGLMRDTGRVLLDAEMDAPVVEEVREVVRELPGAPRLRDLHVWRVGTGRYACILSLTADRDLTPDEVRSRLAIHDELVHVTVEIHVRAPA
jgi:Co/Zn/Cd efflux system component